MYPTHQLIPELVATWVPLPTQSCGGERLKCRPQSAGRAWTFLLDLSPGARTGSRGACKRCAQVEDIPQQQVAELQETARKLSDIRAAEEDLDSSLQKQSGGHTACGQTAQTSSFKRMGPDSFQQCPAAGEEARYTN